MVPLEATACPVCKAALEVPTISRTSQASPTFGPGSMPLPQPIVSESAARPPLPSGQPPVRPSRSGVDGVARDVRQRTESEKPNVVPTQVWTFRIERYDEQGRALPPVPVEMRGKSFRGALVDGDWVHVGARWHPGRTLHPHRVLNLTTGDRISSGGQGCVGSLIVLLVFIIVVIAVLIAYPHFTGHPGTP